MAEAEELAKKAGDSFVPVERLLMALAMVKSKAKDALDAGKVTAQGLNAAINDIRKGRTADSASAEDGYDALVKYNEKEIRRLTITELKRIQSFPDNYIIDGSNKDIIMQIGNAVACKFAYYLGKYIINTLL